MASTADPDDLMVLTPTGERCRFSLEIETVRDGDRTRPVIRKLVRQVL
jgi:NADH-quinone oxidoreductase subunit G